jgi:hypothetical protein
MDRLTPLPRIVIAVFALANLALAQPAREQPDMKIDAAARTEVIEGVVKMVTEKYVFPDVAEKMAKAIRERMGQKEYDTVSSAQAFAQKLTRDLREVSHDTHLSVDYFAKPFPQQERKEPTDEDRKREERMGQIRNFGFEKVERLSGNIGYLDLRGFFAAEFGGETATAAMSFLANTDALIIDVRQNGGGAPGMVALICSYFFTGEPVHLNDLYWRPTNSTEQWWTLAYVPGRRYVGKDIYVLTSKRTFSAAEEFTYNLKNLKRATIVGDTTGGGAHPGEGVRISDHFGMFVPTGRAINPITKTNWEGTGVAPDISVPADLALKTAHLSALNKLESKEQDPELKRQLREIAGWLRKELDDTKLKAN